MRIRRLALTAIGLVLLGPAALLVQLGIAALLVLAPSTPRLGRAGRLLDVRRHESGGARR